MLWLARACAANRMRTMRWDGVSLDKAVLEPWQAEASVLG